MLKNLTLQRLSTFLSLAITTGNLIIAGLLFYFWHVAYSKTFLIGVSILFLVLNFLIARFVLEKFIFEKIRVLYKLISEIKLTPKEKKSINLDQRSIRDVEQDVLRYTNEKNSEIRQLQSLEKYRKEYIGNVSHELKTPIFALQGYLHSLLDGGMYEEKINKMYIQKAAKNADRLSHIVDDLESIHSFENAKNSQEFEVFEIKRLVDEVYDELARSANLKNIKLMIKDGANANFKVHASRDGIRRVFVNLINNAIKYGKEGGTVKTSFYLVQNDILIEVTDDGIGIEEKHLKHLFDRFYRVDAARSRKAGGSGLGLSLVKHIIESHGYKISVRSRFKIGTTFSFMLEKS